MNNIIKSETIKTDNAIHTIALIDLGHGEYERKIMSTDKDWNVSMGFTSLEAAEKRYSRDLKALTPKQGEPTYGHQKLSREDYIKAVAAERLVTAATDELHEQAVDMLNNTPTAADRSDEEIDHFITTTEKEMITALIAELKDYSKRLSE